MPGWRSAIVVTLGLLAGCSGRSIVRAPGGVVLAFEAGKTVSLPSPHSSGGMPLLTALSNRRSVREFAPGGIGLQTLSDLLWAASGVNRAGLGKRTAATAMNWQNLDVYVVMEQGAYRYDPAPHSLVPVAGGDLRALSGKQPFVATAPVNLVYVSDMARMGEKVTAEERLVFGGAHAGLVAQNVYLLAASEGLATVLRASFDPVPLAQALHLSPAQRIILAQTVGLPK